MYYRGPSPKKRAQDDSGYPRVEYKSAARAKGQTPDRGPKKQVRATVFFSLQPDDEPRTYKSGPRYTAVQLRQPLVRHPSLKKAFRVILHQLFLFGGVIGMRRAVILVEFLPFGLRQPPVEPDFAVVGQLV